MDGRARRASASSVAARLDEQASRAGVEPGASRSGSLRAVVRLLRPLQWIKNLFVFAPLLFTAAEWSWPSLWRATLAFAAFCLAASAIYVVNDLADAPRDRRHPRKRHRPIAAGQVSRAVAAACIAAAASGALAISILAVPPVLAPIAGYVAANVAYSLWLKHRPVLDIFCVAAGFVLRVGAGALALGVPLSSWMFVTTLCLALYLASVKRHQELLQRGPDPETRAVLRHYSVELVDRYAEMSAVGTLLFYGLFVLHDGSRLVATIPLVLFGLFRYWYVVDAKGEGESPTDALVRDAPLIATIAAWALLVVAVLSGWLKV